MATIHKLSSDLINKIAAGEVIEDPSSVVKELVENALDAKATHIVISVEAGGLRSITVVDNGGGIKREDLILAFERHATSKLKTFDELFSLRTMGFRGEALSSIASIAKMEVETAYSDQAFRVLVEQGKVSSITESQRNRGTSIEVRALFHNVPVRRQFQKSIAVLSKQIHRIVDKIALANPKISFTLFVDQQKRSEYLYESKMSLENNLRKRVEQILGNDLASNMYFVNYEKDAIQIFGFIAHPLDAKQMRTKQYLSINNRAINSQEIADCIKQGYKTRLSEKLYPCFVLNITLPAVKIDVNVHPQKKTIRLLANSELKPIIEKAISNSFESKIQKKSVSFISSGTFTPSSFRLTEPLIFKNDQQILQQTLFNQDKHISFKPYALIGKYLMLESHDLIEQMHSGPFFWMHIPHAFSKLLYESFTNKTVSLAAQSLLIPINIDIESEQMYLFERAIDNFPKMGLVCRQLGENTICIDQYPILLQPDQVEPFFLSMLQAISMSEKIETKAKHQLAKQIANNALSFNYHIFSYEEAISLAHSLFELEEFCFAPNGKPVLLAVEEEDLNKLFSKKDR